MEIQGKQPTNDASISSEMTTVSSPQTRQIISPTTQSIAKGRWVVAQIFGFLVELPSYVGSFFNEYRQLIISIAVIWGVAITLRVVLAIMDALDDIPVVAPTFELIGVGYSVWFVSRYLLKASNRQKLAQQTQEVLTKQGKDAVTSAEGQHLNEQEQDAISTIASESQQLFKPGEIVPTSGRYQLINSAGSSEGREVTSTKGEHFPPTPGSGMYYKLVDPTHHKNQEVVNQQENDVTTTENQHLYKPGEIVPQSGQYELINVDGISQRREVTSTKGEHFPPTPESGMHYKLVDPTHHKK